MSTHKYVTYKVMCYKSKCTQPGEKLTVHKLSPHTTVPCHVY